MLSRHQRYQQFLASKRDPAHNLRSWLTVAQDPRIKPCLLVSALTVTGVLACIALTRLEDYLDTAAHFFTSPAGIATTAIVGIGIIASAVLKCIQSKETPRLPMTFQSDGSLGY